MIIINAFDSVMKKFNRRPRVTGFTSPANCYYYMKFYYHTRKASIYIMPLAMQMKSRHKFTNLQPENLFIHKRIALFFSILIVFSSICHNKATGHADGIAQVDSMVATPPKMSFPAPAAVMVGGLLGEAITKSEQGRLFFLPNWNDGRLFRMFDPEARLKSDTNDWYGEHGGKWLYAAALAVDRTADKKLKDLLFKTADFLASTQEKDGYLGTYSPDRRITNTSYKFFSSSWDVWNLSYMVLGLLKIDKYCPNEIYLSSAKKIGELFLKTFGEGQQNITSYGTRRGISATVILVGPEKRSLYGAEENRAREKGGP
jgi:hypothetical protein